MQSKGGERGAGKGRRQTQREGRWTECWQAWLPGLILPLPQKPIVWLVESKRTGPCCHPIAREKGGFS